MSLKSWGSRFLYAGVMGFASSYILAEYFSTSLYNLYHDWTGWRKFTGNDPNQTTGVLYQSTWAILFVSNWWMLVQLDRFFEPIEQSSNLEPDETEEQSPQTEFQEKKSEAAEDKEKTCDIDEGIYESESNKPSLRDLHFGKILGVNDLNDPNSIKAAYRKTIAQYHPDRVRAMGPEIREVAENKAKEINQAYEYFRKKFEEKK